MPLQGVPSGEGVEATSNHQLTPKHVRSGLDMVFFGHALLDAYVVQVGPVHHDPTARPLFRLHPTIVSDDMALEVRDALVPLEVLTSDDGTTEVGFRIDQPGAILTLEVTRGDVTSVRMRAPVGTRRGNVLLGFGSDGTSGGKVCATMSLGLGGDLAILLLLRGSRLSGMIVPVIIGGYVVGIASIRLGTIAARGRGGWAGGGRGGNV